jgi:hypothetical protein
MSSIIIQPQTDPFKFIMWQATKAVASEGSPFLGKAILVAESVKKSRIFPVLDPLADATMFFSALFGVVGFLTAPQPKKRRRCNALTSLKRPSGSASKRVRQFRV